MPARLVYAPCAYVFTKNSNGDILNLTDYVVAGQVQRLINQASTANVRLRNPMKRFTTPSQGVAFHPMDPITIFLERLQGFPVQVFSGYLDETPYYQMYPGVIELKATCTLKRLVYSYWDPSLPYINAFMRHWGWINNNGQLMNLSGVQNQGTVAQGQAQLANNRHANQDSSIGKLLWAVLTDVGNWKDADIWIEKLPTGANGIAARMSRLMATLTTDDKQTAKDFDTFMQQIIGAGSQGSGGGPGGGGGSSGGKGGSSGTAIVTAQVPKGKGLAWKVTASQESDNLASNSGGSAYGLPLDGYSELMSDSGLGHLPGGTKMFISSNGKTVLAEKCDNGAGSSFSPVMGLYPRVTNLLGLSGGQYEVIIWRQDGQPLHPQGGTPI